ncbi:SNF2-related protein [Vibrio europaeus]|uniref:SNF2-related protein n=1 Tax=Vibrio europaeus TaxID=300876 RepID=UPI00233F7384|nr:SNF2-related protein [Vibrio europaeus]MDC5753585.1 SNF2-related protein [Vibrio europaeus]MDC5816502.1 SNF2-related protein [Vibrio europaeus]
MKGKQFDGKVSIDGDKWVLSEVKPHVCIWLKRLFPKLSQYAKQPYFLTDSPSMAADIAWMMQRYRFEIDAKTKRYLNKQHRYYLNNQAKAEAILSPDYIPAERLGFNDGYALRDYQKIAVDFVEHAKSALILDEIGLGKTIEGLGIATIPGATPTVFVVQPHLHDQWNGKALEFMSATVHKIMGSKPYSLPPADIYIIKYNQLSSWVDVLTQGWVKGLVFDEVQELRRGTESGKGAAAHAICDCVEHKVGLTASLVYNYGIESYNVANMLRPGILGSRDEFLREWCVGEKGVVGDPDALGAYLVDQGLVIRRTKADVGQAAKQMAPHIEWVEHSAKAVEDFEQLTKDLAMRALAGSYEETGQASREFDLRMRQMTGISKAKQVAAFVRMFVNSGEPVLLYGWHREVYDIWMRELADLEPVMFTGSESPKQKEQAKQDFISGKSKVMIMSLGSGAGLDGLQHVCSTVVFGEFEWSSEKHRQCIGRLDRDGQKNEVFVFYAATDFGSDPLMLDVIGIKKGQSDGIMNPYARDNESIKQVDTNRIRNLAKQYLAKNGISEKQIERERRENRMSKDEISLHETTDILLSGKYSLSDEMIAQDDIEKVLIKHGVEYEREKHMNESDIVDFFLPATGVVIEVKAAKDWSKTRVHAQCERYCQHDSVKGIVLATAKMQGLPKFIAGKPTKVFQMSLTAI